jgi:hypothetical protein
MVIFLPSHFAVYFLHFSVHSLFDTVVNLAVDSSGPFLDFVSGRAYTLKCWNLGRRLHFIYSFSAVRIFIPTPTAQSGIEQRKTYINDGERLPAQ